MSENYRFHHCIGKGNFGDVYKATELKSSSLVAIKVINLEETNEDIRVLIQEIQFLSRLHSPYITRYFETFVNEMSMFIVMEYCGGGSCADLLRFYKTLSEDLVAYIIRDVLRGLSYLHQEKKVHRDIKSANILLTEKGEVKLADFGVSGEITLTQVKRNTFVGTPFWMAPEVITRRKSGGYNEKADIWSTGITTIELITGSPPLAQFDPMKILFEIPKNKPPALSGAEYSENIKDFVKYCLLKDPRKRPSSAKLLHHRFISTAKSNVNLVKIINQKNLRLELTNKAAKKPRHDKFSKPVVSATIHWDLNTFKTYHSSRMQQTLMSREEEMALKSLDWDIHQLEPSEREQEQEIQGLQGPGVKDALSDRTGGDQGGSGERPREDNANAALDAGDSRDHGGAVANRISRGEILFYCLEQVYLRGRNDSTKLTVQQLINNVLEYEQDQPGLCEAIIEEILQFR